MEKTDAADVDAAADAAAPPVGNVVDGAAEDEEYLYIFDSYDDVPDDEDADRKNSSLSSSSCSMCLLDTSPLVLAVVVVGLGIGGASDKLLLRITDDADDGVVDVDDDDSLFDVVVQVTDDIAVESFMLGRLNADVDTNGVGGVSIVGDLIVVIVHIGSRFKYFDNNWVVVIAWDSANKAFVAGLFLYERNSSESSDDESFFLAPDDDVVNNLLSPVETVGVGEADVIVVIGDVGVTDTSMLICFFVVWMLGDSCIFICLTESGEAPLLIVSVPKILFILIMGNIFNCKMMRKIFLHNLHY